MLIRAFILLSVFSAFLISGTCRPLYAQDQAQEREDDLGLEDIYGEELFNAPPIMRGSFEKTIGKPWHDSTYQEREAFILQWKKEKASFFEEDKAKAKGIVQKKKLQAKKERQWQKDKVNRQKVEQARERAKVAEKRAQEKKIQALKKKRDLAMKRLKKAQQRSKRR